jgi:hypothetical protein
MELQSKVTAAERLLETSLVRVRRMHSRPLRCCLLCCVVTDGSKVGSGFDLDALEDLNRAVSSMRRKEEAMRKREAEAASAEEQPRVSGRGSSRIPREEEKVK